MEMMLIPQQLETTASDYVLTIGISDEYTINFLAEDRCELVHDPAFQSQPVVLGCLTYACQFEFVNPAFAEELIERECEYAVNGCR